MSERKFVIRVAVTSLVIALVVGGLGFGLWWQRDAIREGRAVALAGQGDYDRALEIAGTMEEEALQAQTYAAIGDSLFAAARYAEAGKLYRQLGGEEDERYLSCCYAIAEGIYQGGDPEGALTAFAALGGFSDSRQRQLEIRYEMAMALLRQGDFTQAVLDFLALGEYENSPAMALRAAMAVTGGDEAVAREMLAAGGVAPEAMAKELALAQRRGIYDTVVIAAGAYHTVLLRPDGTVAACGDNTYGQCDVADWRDIVQIAAGAYHTVGLKADGTVVAAGRNTHGQCDVAGWQDIAQIAAGDSDTLGLTRGGTAVAAGFHDYKDILRAEGLSALYAGAYGAAARTELGSLLFSHESHGFQSRRQILELALHTGYYAALQSDGSCLSNLEPVTAWEDTVFVAAGPTAVLGVDLTGAAKALFFRESDTVDLSKVADACQCAAGTAHFVFVMADGTVAAFGDNTYGQCDVEALGKAK